MEMYFIYTEEWAWDFVERRIRDFNRRHPPADNIFFREDQEEQVFRIWENYQLVAEVYYQKKRRE